MHEPRTTKDLLREADASPCLVSLTWLDSMRTRRSSSYAESTIP